MPARKAAARQRLGAEACEELGLRAVSLLCKASRVCESPRHRAEQPSQSEPHARRFPGDPTFTNLEVTGGERVQLEELKSGQGGRVDRCPDLFYLLLPFFSPSASPLPFLCFFSPPFLSPSTLLSLLFRSRVPGVCRFLPNFWYQGSASFLQGTRQAADRRGWQGGGVGSSADAHTSTATGDQRRSPL